MDNREENTAKNKVKSVIPNAFDAYDRTARIYPALLAIAPIFWTVWVFHPELLVDGKKIFGSVGALLVGMTLFANIARHMGKKVEERLNIARGGWRTTVILRHRDDTINQYTKKRYHERLTELCKGLKLPSPNEENHDPKDADAKYRSATECLKELRRGNKYHLLDKENALYGFRRNLLGIKPVGNLITTIMTGVALIAWWLNIPRSFDTLSSVLTDMASRWQVYSLIFLDLGYITLWILIVRPDFVNQASNEYALALFRTLEERKEAK